MSKKKKFLIGLGVALATFAVAAIAATPSTASVAPDGTGVVRTTAATPDILGYQRIVPGSVYQAQLNNGTVNYLRAVPAGGVFWSSLNNGIVSEDKLAADVKAKLNKVGAQGPAGPAGKDAIVSVTALTSLTNRPDSAVGGTTWAKDNLTRSVAITRQSAVPASNCPGATTCWFYTGSLIDNGTFTTVAGANSPQAGTPINGVVQGDVSGGTKLEFYASSASPDPSLVQGSVDGGAYPTSEWPSQFFPAGVVVTPAGLLDWSWSYSASDTCEIWKNALAGNSGDVKGVNACTAK